MNRTDNKMTNYLQPIQPFDYERLESSRLYDKGINDKNIFGEQYKRLHITISNQILISYCNYKISEITIFVGTNIFYPLIPILSFLIRINIDNTAYQMWNKRFIIHFM